MTFKINVEVDTLEKLRGAKGIKYKDMSKHISKGTYRDIVIGKAIPTPQSMGKLTQIFKIPKEDIEGLLKNKG